MDTGQISYDGTPDHLSSSPSILTDLGVSFHPSIYSEVLPTENSIEQELLTIRDLTFTYPRIEELTPAQPALRKLTFSLPPGQIVGLMGANGSGKSTLLLQLMGLLKPDIGTILLEQQNIHEMQVSRVARDIGFIFQNPLHQIFASTVFEEVLLASKHLGIPESSEAERRADRLLNAFGLHAYRDHSPYSLSLGEQRRLTIASILLHQPQVLLLDEPFIGQDYLNVHRLMDVIQNQVSRGTTVVLATHDKAVVETYCSRLLFLFKGRLLIDAPIKQGFEFLPLFKQTGYSSEPKSLEVDAEE
jgi:energy-coupling factor transport system ATP-binding protein